MLLPLIAILFTSSAKASLDPRQLTHQGSESGLEIHVHSEPNCAGPYIGFAAIYTAKQPIQINSYNLNRDLNSVEVLDFWNALPGGGPINPTFNGDTVACSFFIETAQGSMRKSGCSTMNAPAGCLRLWVPPAQITPAPSLQTDDCTVDPPMHC